MCIGIVVYFDFFVGYWCEDCRDGIFEMLINGWWKEVCRSGIKFVG